MIKYIFEYMCACFVLGYWYGKNEPKPRPVTQDSNRPKNELCIRRELIDRIAGKEQQSPDKKTHNSNSSDGNKDKK